MKGLACGQCMDLRALPQGNLKPVSCNCGNVTAWWLDGKRGIARFTARSKHYAFGLGLNNTYLLGALSQPDDGQPSEDWRKLHDDACNAPGYLFDTSNRGCWALIFRPGVTSDTAWATDSKGPSERGRRKPMLTVDARCTMPQCEHKKGIYRMVGWCKNCGAEPILMLFSEGHEKSKRDCPNCGCYWSVEPQRLATDEEIPVA